MPLGELSRKGRCRGVAVGEMFPEDQVVSSDVAPDRESFHTSEDFFRSITRDRRPSEQERLEPWMSMERTSLNIAPHIASQRSDRAK